MVVRKARTANELNDLLLKRAVDCIAIENDLFFDEPIMVWRPVRFVGRPDAVIQWQTYSSNGDEHSLFRVKVPGVYFDLINTVGGGKQLTGDRFIDGLQSAIKFENTVGDGFVNDCIFEGFNWGGVWAFDCEKLLVNRSQFIGPGNPYFNYGIWQGGRGNASGQKLITTGCSFDLVRHAIGASGHPNHYHAIDNIIGPDILQQAFDRHTGNTPGVGGGDVVLLRNTFHAPNRHAFNIQIPDGPGKIVIMGNQFNRPLGKAGVIADTPAGENVFSSRLSIFGNIYAPS